jgi:hypothetical protein
MKHGARLKPLRPVYLGDDLFACQSVVERLTDNGDDFLFTCKETSHKALYDFIDGCEFERCDVRVRKGKTHETHRYRFVEKVPLRDGKDAVTAQLDRDQGNYTNDEAEIEEDGSAQAADEEGQSPGDQATGGGVRRDVRRGRCPEEHRQRRGVEADGSRQRHQTASAENAD